MARLLMLPLMTLPAFVGVALACTGCARPQPTYESLDWNVGPNFDRVYQQIPGKSGIRTAKVWESYYVKKGETADNWTLRAESVVWDTDSAAFLGGFHRQPESVMAYTKDQLKWCATNDWTVLEQDKTSILYEWKSIVCPGYRDQQEIVRIIMGRLRLWIIWYGVRNTTLSPDERTALVDNLLTAKVMRGVGD